MEKEIFYNEYVKNTIDFAAATNQASEDELHQVIDRMYNHAVVNIFKRPSSEVTMNMSLTSDVHYEGISFQNANRFLKTHAAGLQDDDTQRWFLISKWYTKDKNVVRAFVGDIVVTGRDRDNDSIIQDKIVSKYINQFDDKLKNSSNHSHDLETMLKLPEIRAFMLDQAKTYIHDVHIERVAVPEVIRQPVKTHQQVREQSSAWMMPNDDIKPREGVARKGGRC